MPYMTGYSDEIEKALFLHNKFGVAYWALTYPPRGAFGGRFFDSILKQVLNYLSFISPRETKTSKITHYNYNLVLIMMFE